MNDFRQYIKEAHLKDDEDYEFVLDDDKLKMYFYIFNDKYFDNKLKGIPLKTVDFNTTKVKNSFGYTDTFIDYRNHKLITLDISINKDRISNFIGFTNTLVHEMLHYYVNTFYQPSINLWNEVDKLIEKNHINDDNVNQYIDQMKKILKIDDISSHEGKWKIMADELNNKFKELNITDVGNGADNIDADYISSFIEKYTLYLKEHLDKKIIYRLENESQDQKNLLTVIERGESTNDLYIGTWYKLDISKESEKFDLFIIHPNIHKHHIFDNETIIEMGLDSKAYIKERLGYIKRVNELKESKLSPEEIENNIKILEKQIIVIE